MTRTLRFDSGGTVCVANFYSPPNSADSLPCVVMGHGFTGTQDQLTRYAESFVAAGLAVLTFDYRHFGQSGGQPRQVINIKEQLADWRAAIKLARSLEQIDPSRVALWGTSLSGGYVLTLAADDPTIAAVVAQAPALEKSTRSMVTEARAKMQREKVSFAALTLVSLKSLAAGIYDSLRGLLGLSPHYLRVFGAPGEAAAFSDSDSETHLAFFTKAGATWRNEFAPRFLFGIPTYLKGTAERVRVPLLVCVAERDNDADPELAMAVARKAPRGELKIYPCRHFDIYVDPILKVVLNDQTRFLNENLGLSTTHKR